MIYITGDIHIPIDLFKLDEDMFPEQKTMTKSDYLIICGDFGGIWGNGRPDNVYLERLSKKNFTTLWVDGNHENYSLLKNYRVEQWNGGKVQFIKDDIIHLMRGQVFEIEGLKFFTFGGGYSIDKAIREPGRTWWNEEMPNFLEYAEGKRNLKKHGYKVDYMVTHTAPLEINENIYKKGLSGERKLNLYISEIQKMVEYKHHYFGHFHDDRKIDDKHTCLYFNIERIK